MAAKSLGEFIQNLQADQGLQQALRQRLQGNNDPTVLMAFAKETGYSFALDDLSLAEPQPLSNEEMLANSGGGGVVPTLPSSVLGAHKGI